MKALKQMEETGVAAVYALRRRKLDSGLPFMINSADLLPDQCYLEYPDGRIQLVTADRYRQNFRTIHELSEAEILLLRKKYHIL